MIALVYYPLAVGVLLTAFISAVICTTFPTEKETPKTAKLIRTIASISWTVLAISIPITLFLAANKL